MRCGCSTGVVWVQYGTVRVRCGCGTVQYGCGAGAVRVRYGCCAGAVRYGTGAVRVQYGTVCYRFIDPYCTVHKESPGGHTRSSGGKALKA